MCFDILLVAVSVSPFLSPYLHHSDHAQPVVTNPKVLPYHKVVFSTIDRHQYASIVVETSIEATASDPLSSV
ncbi:hypothetical protein N431DRAFT_438097 [Stipitochalara longipes BDJ]|nr:hypothetical protein N431DRAFT_438097 [Stipitochalara longipes BDJ]